MRRFLAFFLLLCTVCLSHASADGYSELIPGSIVSNILDESIPFWPEPNLQSNPIGTLGAGVSMRLLSLEPEGLAHVRLEGGSERREGYVRADAVMTGDYLYWESSRVVNPQPGERLNLRNKPSEQSPSLGKYYTGVIVQNFHQDQNGFARVVVGTQVGFMDKRYLADFDPAEDFPSEMPAAVVENPHGTGGNLRRSPSAGSKKLRLCPNGTELTVLGVTPNGWCHVMVQGETGFIMADKLSPEFSFHTH